MELLIGEMIQPTHACKPLVEEYIRPQFNLLLDVIDEFVPPKTPVSDRQQLAFSIVGQCLHYRVARGFVSLLVSPQAESSLLEIETLSKHITHFSIAALSHWSQSGQMDRRSVGRSRRSTSSRESVTSNPS